MAPKLERARLTLRDYMLWGGAEGRAFVYDGDKVYIVRGFRLVGEAKNIGVDVELISSKKSLETSIFSLGWQDSHLYDRKATASDIRKARSG